MIPMLQQAVVLKETKPTGSFGYIARKAFDKQDGIKVAGAIGNGNTPEMLERGKEPIYFFGPEAEFNALRNRHRRDRQRIRPASEINPNGTTLVDIDSMPIDMQGFGRNVVQHWSQKPGSRLYFETGDSEVLKVDKSVIIAPYLALQRLADLIDYAIVNITKQGEKPKEGSKDAIANAISSALEKRVVVAEYTNGVRFYDIMITIFSKHTITQNDLAERLHKAPRIQLEFGDVGTHDIPGIRLRATREGRLMPPIIACISREPPSTMQTLRLVTDPHVTIAAANIDAVRSMSGTNMNDAMRMTDQGLGLSN
ncbi:MAG: hypothetical protein ACP5N9_02335 [Candidatus Bilamarchaeum sp.]